MATRARHRAAAVLLACLCLSACEKARADLTDYETRATAEVREAQRRAEEGPEKPTRQQALAEYRRCIRKMSSSDTLRAGMRVSDPQRACAHWMEKAYPPARNARKRASDSIPWSTEPQWVDPSRESRIPNVGRVPAGTP